MKKIKSISNTHNDDLIECKNVTDLKACSTQLKQSTSFHGVNKTPLIRCILFAIKNKSLAGVDVSFYNLVIQSAYTVVEFGEASAFEIIMANTTIAENTIGVHSKILYKLRH